MSKEKDEEKESEGMFMDGEVVIDGLGITHFLPPKKCANCDD